MNDRKEVWLRAWTAVAGCFNASAEASTRYADACLKDFDERFKPPEAQWLGKPISQLGPEELEGWRKNILSRFNDIKRGGWRL